ncbi:MAG: DUF3368 domain-containing protein [Deltaproteobacteria bacterium]|nr:DUF3368 domain-containing protein [Deltaproteobacteria bacterium]
MSAPVVVADAGPLIALGRIGQLWLLRDLYGIVLIPPCVFEELQVESGRPGAKAAAEALREGWLRVQIVRDSSALSRLVAWVHPGEAQAIVLAQEVPLRFLLVDDRRAREAGRRSSVKVVGTGGVLLTAKRRGLIEAVGPLVADLSAAGYRLSQPLIDRLLALAGE